MWTSVGRGCVKFYMKKQTNKTLFKITSTCLISNTRTLWIKHSLNIIWLQKALMAFLIIHTTIGEGSAGWYTYSTHWGRDKWMPFCILYFLEWESLQTVVIDNKTALVQAMAWLPSQRYMVSSRLPLGKIAISQTTFSNAFSLNEKEIIFIKISLKFVQGPIDNNQALV